MLSNYPDGVTGAERQIAGPDSETEVVATCYQCGEEHEVLVAFYGDTGEWECPTCYALNEVTGDGD